MANDRRNPLAVAVLVSGNGTNLQAILDRIDAGGVNAAVKCVISNRPDAYALERARRHGIKDIVLENRNFGSRREYDTELVRLLKEQGVELVVLAGFMRILSDVMINAFPNAIMNIHPALLPSFPGLDAQKQALDYGVRYSGCTVHFVDCGTDTGPIILQSVVPVHPDDTPESLSDRIHIEEHRLYPEAIRLFAENRLHVDGRMVRIEL